jgi:hypothetical protein
MKTVNMFTKSTAAVILIFALLLTACNKERSSGGLTDEAAVEAITNDNEADAAYDEVFNNTMGIGSEAGEDLGLTAGVGVFGRMEDNGYVSGRVDSQRCFTITVTPQQPGTFPKTVTLNFGDGCLGRDGKLRKGKIITVYTGPMRISGSKATTTFDRYKVDSMAVEGTHIVTNNSLSNNKIFTTTVLNGKLSWDSGRWVKWSTTRTVAQLEGNGTPNFPGDDLFAITGAGRGENSNSKSWAHEIIEPLIKKFSCRWISKGIVHIRINDKTGILNFGDGQCDNKATITVNGNTRTITLR